MAPSRDEEAVKTSKEAKSLILRGKRGHPAMDLMSSAGAIMSTKRARPRKKKLKNRKHGEEGGCSRKKERTVLIEGENGRCTSERRRRGRHRTTEKKICRPRYSPRSLGQAYRHDQDTEENEQWAITEKEKMKVLLPREVSDPLSSIRRFIAPMKKGEKRNEKARPKKSELKPQKRKKPSSPCVDQGCSRNETAD